MVGAQSGVAAQRSGQVCSEGEPVAAEEAKGVARAPVDLARAAPGRVRAVAVAARPPALLEAGVLLGLHAVEDRLGRHFGGYPPPLWYR